MNGTALKYSVSTLPGREPAISFTMGSSGHTPLLNDRHLTVLLLDRRPMLRDCVAKALAIVDPHVRIVQAAEVGEAVAEAGILSLCVMATGSLPVGDEWVKGTHAALDQAFAGVPIAVLADSLNLDDILACLQMGIRGYFTTEMDLRIVVEAARLIRRGGIYVPAEALLLRREIAQRSGQPDRTRRCILRGKEREETGGPMSTLTPREFEVLMRLRQGKPNKVIAFELEMSESTVKVHVQSIMRKLGARNRTQVTYLTQAINGADDLVAPSDPAS